jgi:hypothetical protein
MKAPSRRRNHFPLPYAALLYGTVASRRDCGKCPKDVKLARKAWTEACQKQETSMEKQEVGESTCDPADVNWLFSPTWPTWVDWVVPRGKGSTTTGQHRSSTPDCHVFGF